MSNRTLQCDIHPNHDMSDHSFIADPRFDKDRYIYTEPLSEDDMGAMFSAVADVTVDGNPGPVGRLRQWSTWMRVAVGVLVAASLSALTVAVVGLRVDLADADLGVLLSSLIMAGLGVGAAGLSLRGLHRPTADGYAGLISGLILLAPLGLSLLLGTGVTSAVRVMPWTTGCFLAGAAVAGLSGGTIVLLQRDRRLAVWRVLAAAGVGGSAGFTTQSLFCPASDTWHLVSAHGGVAVVIAVLMLIGQQIWQRL